MDGESGGGWIEKIRRERVVQAEGLERGPRECWKKEGVPLVCMCVGVCVRVSEGVGECRFSSFSLICFILYHPPLLPLHSTFTTSASLFPTGSTNFTASTSPTPVRSVATPPTVGQRLFRDTFR